MTSEYRLYFFFNIGGIYRRVVFGDKMSRGVTSSCHVGEEMRFSGRLLPKPNKSPDRVRLRGPWRGKLLLFSPSRALLISVGLAAVLAGVDWGGVERSDVVRRCGDRGHGVERGTAGVYVLVPLRGSLPDHARGAPRRGADCPVP